MTISTSTSRWAYVGDGATKAFPYTSRIFAHSDLAVYVAGLRKALTTDYTLTKGTPVGGGTVTFKVAPPAGAAVLLVRDVPLTQEIDYRAGDRFPAETHELGLDKLTVLCQQLADRIDRGLSLDPSDPASLGPLPAVRAGRILLFDADGQPTAPLAEEARVALGLPPGPDAWSALGISSYARELLDDADAAAARGTLGLAPGSSAWAALGISSYARSLLDDADAQAALTTLGVSAFARTLLDDGSAATALTTLGVSGYARTLLDDPDAAAALTTLGASAFAQALLADASGAAMLARLGVSAYVRTILDDPDAGAARSTLGLAPGDPAWSALGIDQHVAAMISGAGGSGVLAHASLAALGADDHPHYLTVARADTWFAGNLDGNGDAGTAARSDHDHDGVYEPSFAKATAFNRDFGAAADEVAAGDHGHDAAAIATGTLARDRLPLLGGDAGSGGDAGAAPAPLPGDAAAGKFLAADAVWRVPVPPGIVATLAAFPASPSPGEMVYRTDLGCLFFYDAARGKWLGEMEWDGGGYSGDLGQNTYMRRFNGADMSSTAGIYVPYDITIVGLAACWNIARTALVRVHRSGVVVATAGTGANVAAVADTALNADFAAGGVMAFSTTNHATAVNMPQVHCWWRRRAA